MTKINGERIALLEAENAVRRTVGTMVRALDEGDWQVARECLSQKCTGSARVEGGRRAELRGAEALLAAAEGLTHEREGRGIRTTHVLGEMLVKWNGRQAQLYTFQTAYLYSVADIAAPKSRSGSHGRYSLEQENGTWKVVAFDIDRVWAEGEPY